MSYSGEYEWAGTASSVSLINVGQDESKEIYSLKHQNGMTLWKRKDQSDFLYISPHAFIYARMRNHAGTLVKETASTHQQLQFSPSTHQVRCWACFTARARTAHAEALDG